jgi:hypothetical protein
VFVDIIVSGLCKKNEGGLVFLENLGHDITVVLLNRAILVRLQPIEETTWICASSELNLPFAKAIENYLRSFGVKANFAVIVLYMPKFVVISHFCEFF